MKLKNFIRFINSLQLFLFINLIGFSKGVYGQWSKAEKISVFNAFIASPKRLWCLMKRLSFLFVTFGVMVLGVFFALKKSKIKENATPIVFAFC